MLALIHDFKITSQPITDQISKDVKVSRRLLCFCSRLGRDPAGLASVSVSRTNVRTQSGDQKVGPRFTKHLTTILRLSYGNATVTID